MKISTKNTLRKAIQVAIAGSALASGLSFAQLQDFGPSDPTIIFPDWYRDTTGTALGLCRSTSTYCFPLTANPAGFAGNIGDEAFYSLVEFVGTNTGSDFQFRYLGALEASYLPGPTPRHGDETVFARIRITFNFNDTAKNGTYTVTHPYGVHVFENVQATQKTNLIGGQAANFFTVDVGAGQGFEGPLTGPVGPFVRWDKDLPISIGTPGTPDYEEFLGDPTVPHTFTGSPFGTNFLKIEGPAGSNLDGLNPNPIAGVRTDHDTIIVTEGNVLGQKWTKPISVPLTIDSAVKTRSVDTAGKNGIDVWATTVPNQEVIVTGSGMPSLELIESDIIPGKYHGHIEYPVTDAVPAEIRVTNLSDVNVISKTAALLDIVEISSATFDTSPSSRKLTVVAHSSDGRTQPDLAVQGVTGVASAVMSAAQCAGLTVSATDVCYSTTLASTIEPPAKLSVISTDSGSHADRVLQLIGGDGVQIAGNSPTAENIECGANFDGPVELLAVNCGNDFYPDALVTEQTVNGSVNLVNNKWIYTPSVNAFLAPYYTPEVFKYVRQTANGAPVSNEATVTLVPVPKAPVLKPTTNISSTGFTINFLESLHARSYKVTVGGVIKPFIGAPATSFNVTGLNAGAGTVITVAGCTGLDGTICGTAASINQFTLPAQPATPTVTGITGTSMIVNWTAISGATAYGLDYSLDGTTWTAVGAANLSTGVRLGAAITGASTSANVIGLAANTRYSFRMTVSNQAGASMPSGATTAQSTLNPPPGAPTFTATTAVTTTGFKLNWTAPTLTTGQTLNSYVVTINGARSVVNKAGAVLPTTFTASNLLPGTSNAVTVASCTDTLGADCSAIPRSLTQWTLANVPGTPVVSNIGDTTLNLTWTGSAQSFTIQRSTTADFRVITTTANIPANGVTAAGVTTTTRAITGLAANTTYYFRVLAVTPGGTSAASASSLSATTTLTAPGTIRAANGVAGGAVTAGLTWGASAGAQSYQVMYGSAAQLNANTGTIVTATSGQQIALVGITAGTNNLNMKVRAVKTTAPASVAAPSFSAWSVNTTVTAR